MSEQKLLDALPEHFSKLLEMREIARVEGAQFDRLNADIDDLLDQMFISTATWGLSYWEEQYKLPILVESKDYTKRRQRVLAKKRSNKASLTDILRAIEPSIKLAWGGEILPFTIESTADYYDFGELVRMLEIEKPSHLTYSFSIKPNGYTVRAERRSRNEVALQLISGAAKSGRCPRRNTRGESDHRVISIDSERNAGIADLQQSAGLVSGGVDAKTSFGSSEREFVQISSAPKVGSSRFKPSGPNKSGEISSKTTGSSLTERTKVVSSVATGISTAFACGARSSGEGVA